MTGAATSTPIARSRTAAPRTVPPRGARPNRRRSDRGMLQAAAPPVLALVVSSPAILAGLSGTADPLQVLTVVAVSLAGMFLLLAALAQLGRRSTEPLTVPTSAPGSATTSAAEDQPPAGAAHLGRIEPVRVPASEAIPGDPPPTPATEGPLA